MNETARRSRLPTVESRARRDERWCTIDVFAEWMLSLLACAMVALFLSTSLLFAAPAGQAHGPRSDTRAKAIVNGHTVQPKPSDLRTPDVTTRDAADVDRLYRELMELTAPDARRDLDDAAGPQGLAKTP